MAAARRNVSGQIASLIEGLGFAVIVFHAAEARRVAGAYEQWGNGVHPAGLNLGDCFAYEVAKWNGCRLLSIGDDFAGTDVEGVLH
jgi:ribonuclease VapC